ncbi:fluoride efflux transporter CrcB [Streptococcus cristatus]|uniref:fluoride efflux transporter CrcB n=1 Tax=Streptococcus cristatus TaxID=45634 RepID=UPI0039C06B3E
MIWFLITACGLGALVRYFFSKVNSRAALPVGTLIANVLGAFLIGVFYNHIQDKQMYSILATGFCGGLTTLSTFNAELTELFSEKNKFSLYLILTYILGFLAILLGIFI